MTRVPGFAFGWLLLLDCSSPAFAGPREAVGNWPAPATWTAPPAAGGSRTSLAVSANPLPFIPISPCRVADTRGNGFTGSYGPPSMAGGASRNFTISTQCGIPASAVAVSFNFTVWNTSSYGDLNIYPTGGTRPVVSTLNWGPGVLALANAAVVPLGTSGQITVVNESGSTVDLFFDVNGYYASTQPTATTFSVFTPASIGILGESDAGIGVYGLSVAATDGVCGVRGQATGGARVYGVEGRLDVSAANGSAGVRGITDGGTNVGSAQYVRAGVRGEGNFNPGVIGLSTQVGVLGSLRDVAGNQLAYGYLGFESAGSNYGVWSTGDMHATGAITGASKSFVQPHPLDASKEIRYVSLEGPASEVYFRGTTNVVRGLTRIEIPEHFRLVSRPGSYSAIVSAVGRLASVAVIEEGEDGILVESTGVARVNYVVYAERDAFKDNAPVTANVHFVPDTAEGLPQMPEAYRRILVSNGTLNPDGTTNLETARRLGWSRARGEKAAASSAAVPE